VPKEPHYKLEFTVQQVRWYRYVQKAKLVTKMLFVCKRKGMKGDSYVGSELHALSVLKQVQSLVSSPPAGAAVKNRISQQYRHVHSREHRLHEVQCSLYVTDELSRNEVLLGD
jgi:hypothetical protein